MLGNMDYGNTSVLFLSFNGLWCNVVVRITYSLESNLAHDKLLVIIRTP